MRTGAQFMLSVLMGICGACAHEPVRKGDSQAPTGETVRVPLRWSALGTPMMELNFAAGGPHRQWLHVDTGEDGWLSIHTDTIAALPPMPGGSKEYWSFGVHDVTPFMVEWAEVGGYRIGSFEGSAIRSPGAADVPGAVGVRLLRQWGCVEMNFDAMSATFYPKGTRAPRFEGPLSATLPLVSDEGPAKRQEVLIDGEIGGHQCVVMIDSGFSGFIAAHRSLLTRVGCDLSKAKAVDAKTPFETVTMPSVRLTAVLRLQGHPVRVDGAVVVLDAPPDQVRENEVILGAAFLKKSRIVRFDWDRNELFLVPRSRSSRGN
jgi:predicted aspartyl protease